MTPPTTYISFLIRMWRERDPEQPERLSVWQGEVEHIQSGRRRQFRTIEELVQFLRDPVSNFQHKEE